MPDFGNRYGTGFVNADILKKGGVTITATAAELNYTDVTTVGTAQASKALTSNASLDTTGVRNFTVTGSLLLTGGAAAAAVVARLGDTATEGLEIRVVDEVVTLTNAASTDLTADIPAGAVIICVQANLNTAVVGDASGDNGLTKVGIGITADPDKYGKTSVLTKNAKIDFMPDWAALAGAEDIKVFATDNDGAAVTEKFVAAGLVRVRIVFLACNSLDDAA